MPFDTVHVAKVEKDSRDAFWHIWPVGGQCRADAFTTNSAWKASLCEQGRIQHRPVTVGWTETRRWGKDIIHIELVKEPVPHD